MGWLPWKKKKSELEEKDRQRNVPPLNYAQGSKDHTPTKRSGPTYIGGNENHTAAERAAAAGTPAKKGLPSDAILTPCYRGDTEKVRDLLSGKLGTVSSFSPLSHLQRQPSCPPSRPNLKVLESHLDRIQILKFAAAFKPEPREAHPAMPRPASWAPACLPCPRPGLSAPPCYNFPGGAPNRLDFPTWISRPTAGPPGEGMPGMSDADEATHPLGRWMCMRVTLSGTLPFILRHSTGTWR